MGGEELGGIEESLAVRKALEMVLAKIGTEEVFLADGAKNTVVY
jgi:hypothetical protein